MSSSCAICSQTHAPLSKVTDRGLKTLVEAATKKNDVNLLNYLDNTKNNNNDIFVHGSCRKSFTDKRKVTVK